jgi:hypothetical protein
MSEEHVVGEVDRGTVVVNACPVSPANVEEDWSASERPGLRLAASAQPSSGSSSESRSVVTNVGSPPIASTYASMEP